MMPKIGFSSPSTDSESSVYYNVVGGNSNKTEWIPEKEFSFQNYSAGTFEVNRHPDENVTENDIREAWKVYDRSFEAARNNGWFDYEEARKDGYRLESTGYHWLDLDRKTRTKKAVSPENPHNLIYYDNPNNESQKILAGFMYHKRLGSTEHGPQFGGPLTVWHFHPMRTAGYSGFIRKVVSMRDDIADTSEYFDIFSPEFENLEDYLNKTPRTAEMIHVWFIKHPDGPYATEFVVDEEYIEEPEKMNYTEFRQFALENYANES
ncbi:MAG: hypothetical protein H8Z69_00055 [Nanohaloarchaea archaeon]|nr:hypothetical protein [Candidatus Nanohaloarchaea archaeon]